MFSMLTQVKQVSGSATAGDQTSKIKLLQGMVEQYKTELEDIARDSQALEDQLTQGAGLVKQNLLDESQKRVSQLEAGMSHIHT